MARIDRVSTIVLALVCLVTAAPARSDDVRSAVEAGNRALIAALLGGDAEAVASLYTEDAQVIPPGSAAVSGRSAIAAYWQRSIDSGIKDVTLETAEAEAAGDFAYETGVLRVRAKDDTTTQSRYVVIWRRIDGRWLLHRDTWNPSD